MQLAFRWSRAAVLEKRFMWLYFVFIVIMGTDNKQACVRTCGFIYVYNEIHTYIYKYNPTTRVTSSSCPTRESKDQVGMA